MTNLLTPVVLPSCGPATMDPRTAAADALASYLFSLTFRRWNGTDLREPTTSFQLRAVRHEWPEANADMEYPSASIVDLGLGDYDAANLTPTCLEETADTQGDDTVLWRLSELVADFQVDFFTTDLPTREAIAAGLPSAFSPGETFGVWLRCSTRYYGARCRASMLNLVREDDEAAAGDRERRLRTTVRIEIPVLDLRRSVRANFSATVADLGPAVDAAGCEP